MSKFVDYTKRSITLPAGCKDLSDLLKPHALPGAGDATSTRYAPSGVQHGMSMAGNISDIEKYISMIFATSAGTTALSLGPPDGKFQITVFRIDASGIHGHVNVRGGTDEEKAVRLFFAQRGMKVPADTGVPNGFQPDMPWQVCFDISPLLAEAGLLSKFVADLLRDVFGLSDSSRLKLFHYETK